MYVCLKVVAMVTVTSCARGEHGFGTRGDMVVMQGVNMVLVQGGNMFVMQGVNMDEMNRN